MNDGRVASDIADIRDILGCSIVEARHYLRVFDNNKSRAIEAVIENGSNNDWWAHPWNQKTNSEATEAVEEEKEEIAFDHYENRDFPDDNGEIKSEQQGLNEHVSNRFDNGSEESDEESLNSISSTVRVDTSKLADDHFFYDTYGHLVDDFIDSLCAEGSTRSDLRSMISKADKIVSQDAKSDEIESNLINRPSFKHNQDGRTPLSYAVAKNLKQMVYDMIDFGADISKVMPQKESIEDDPERVPKTALVIAATNQKRYGTEMVRILLSKGASPDELKEAGVEEKTLSLGMRYWINKARRVGVPAKDDLLHLSHLSPMDRIHELDYAVVGEEAAVTIIQEAFAGRFGNPQANLKPLVMLLLGPPGHGKTYFSSNAARSLVGENNFLFVPCQSIRDDADLFGSRLGGARNGAYSSDGQLTKWLRERQGKKCIVFLDEFEKMKDLTSALGWGQAKKIYQSFLEPWNDGFLSDQGALSGTNRSGTQTSTRAGGDKIDCSQCIWILTSNWGQQEIIDFCEKHKGRTEKKIDQKDVQWVKKQLVAKILKPLCIREFGSVHEDVKALCRRIDAIVPFLPFTLKERSVVADIALSDRFALYREPCVLKGPEEKRRSFGNLHLRSTKAFASYAADSYDPMQGASGMLSVVQQADGKFQMMSLRDQLGLTDGQKKRVRSPSPPLSTAAEEPIFWVHYDKESDEIDITQTRPIDDEDTSMSSEEEAEEEADRSTSTLPERSNGSGVDLAALIGRKTTKGAADDAF